MSDVKKFAAVTAPIGEVEVGEIRSATGLTFDGVEMSGPMQPSNVRRLAEELARAERMDEEATRRAQGMYDVKLIADRILARSLLEKAREAYRREVVGISQDELRQVLCGDGNT